MVWGIESICCNQSKLWNYLWLASLSKRIWENAKHHSALSAGEWKINVTQFLLCVYVPPAHCCNSLSPLQCIWVLRFPAGKSLDRELSSHFNTQPPDMCIKFSRPNACSINVCTVLCLYPFSSQSLPYPPLLHKKEREGFGIKL